jgi:hypothetical protein
MDIVEIGLWCVAGLRPDEVNDFYQIRNKYQKKIFLGSKVVVGA